MNIVVKKSALNELIKTLAEERSFHTRRIDQIAGEDKPVMPDAQVATQLSADQAPVSNPDFLPVNTQQLSQAASQMARQVSQDKIQKFYTGLKKLLRKTSEPKQYKGMSETDLMEALRPLVLREAKLTQRYAGEEEDTAPPATASDVTAPLAKTKAEKEKQKKAQKSVASSLRSAKEKLSTGSELSRAEIERLKGKIDTLSPEQLKNLEQNVMRDIALRSKEAVAAAYQRMLDMGSKIPLESVAEGDASRVLDAIKKKNPKMQIPTSVKEAQLSISLSQKQGSTGPSVEIVFSSPLLENPIKILQDGGAVPYEDDNGNESVHYLVDPFPFNQSEYTAAFESSFANAAQKTASKEEERKRSRAARKERNQEPEEVDEKEKKKREDTIRKKLSRVNASEMAFELFQKLEEFKEKGDSDSIDKVFKKLKLPITGQKYMQMSDDDKANLHPEIAEQLDAQRASYYDISHMDYVRDIINAESFESEYFRDDAAISSSDPASVAEEKLLESFFSNCFKPLFNRGLTKIIGQFPEYLDLSEEIFKLDSYNDFVKSGIDIPAWKELVNEIASDAVIKNPDRFRKTIADFYEMYAGVKGGAGTEAYDTRLSVIGMKDIGRQREPFEHIRSPVALMKAVTASAMLEFLDPEESDILKKTLITPDKIRKSFYELLKELRENFVAAKMFIDVPAYKKALKAAGYEDAYDLALAPTDEIMSKIEQTGLIEKLEKAARIRAIEIPGMRNYVEKVVAKFINSIGNYFKTLTETESMFKRGPIYKFIADYAAEVRSNSPDNLDIDELTGLVEEYAAMVGKQVKTAQKDAEKAQAAAKKVK